ncbi:MAG: hypothetical protein O2816_15385 [Planctomycetota bacterium]|nr:hypothetical protein [Planctomycetota bacterium]
MLTRSSALLLTLGLMACTPDAEVETPEALDATAAAEAFQRGRGQQVLLASQPSQERLDRALQLLEEAARLDATKVEHHYYAGVAREAHGNPVAARAHYEAAVACDGTHGQAHWRLGKLLHGEGEVALARRRLERALELGVEDAALLVDLGRVLEDLSELEAAEARYREATRLREQETLAWFRLAHLLRLRGATEEAEQANLRYEFLWSLEQEYAGLRRAVQANPHDPAAQVALARAAQKLGHGDVAVRACEAALVVAPGFEPAQELLDALGSGQ